MKSPSTLPMKASSPPIKAAETLDQNGNILIDLEGEIIRMAERAKVPLTELTKEHITTHYQVFQDAIRQYYKGVDDGKIQGAAIALREMIGMRGKVMIYLAGAATYPTLKLLVKFVLLIIHFYNT
jgi:hypothetical protein